MAINENHKDKKKLTRGGGERDLPLGNRVGELFAQYARGNLTYGTDQNSTQLVT